MVAPPLSTILLLSFILLSVVLRSSFCRAAAAASSHSSTSPSNNNYNNNNDGRRFRSDPYDVLRVDRHCEQGEIRRQYRKLCLRYHPDKKKKKKKGTTTTTTTTTTREERRGRPPDDDDFEFKEVQHAYSLVGTEEDRRKYEFARRIDSLSSSSSSSRRRAETYAGRGDGRRDARRRDDDDANAPFVPSTMYFAFGVGGSGGPTFRFSNDVRRDPFGARGRAYDAFGTSAFAAARGGRGGATATAGAGTTTTTTTAPGRPRYVQEVTVPPDVPCAGDDREVELTLRTSVFDRYRAAHRGGVLRHALVRAALAVLLARLRSPDIGVPLSLALFVSMVHSRVPPPPMRTSYTAVLRRGWKSGTEVRYSDGVSDVTFVLRGGGGHDT